MAFAESKLESPCEELGAESNAEDLYRMGLVYSTGMGVAVDYVTAHKWFNLAALRGVANIEQYIHLRLHSSSTASGACSTST